MAYPQPVADALERLEDRYNGDVMTPANPGGMDGDGHTVNFIPALRDVSIVGKGLGQIATDVKDAAETLPEMRTIRDEVDADRLAAQQAASAAQESAESVDAPAIANRFTVLEARTAILEDAGYQLALVEHFGV